MNDKLFNRYSRQIFMEEIGTEGQRKLGNTRVLVIGAGGLGSPVLQYLAAAGVGKIAVADFDTLELHNLNRQIIHTEKNIGKKKVESASEFIHNFNPHIDFNPLDLHINKQTADELIPQYDIVVDGSDNFATRYLVNDACVQHDKPLVYGSVFSFEGQVAVFNYQGSKQLRDLFPTQPDNAQTCDKFGVLGALTGIVGSLMAMQVLKISLQLPVQTNQLLLIDAMNFRFTTVDF
ncbi:HesA/MoeB/ThiF family protein [Capnocytophaga stomatis]|uniref:HesA/MoeB/ThiF family protein n=1 Tax=Capnocytophaga stomatis TaxID=1848904 RepID=UPI00385CBA7E